MSITYEWDASYNGWKVTSVTNGTGTLTIPDTYDDGGTHGLHNVVSIGDGSPICDGPTYTSIILPSNLLVINMQAFEMFTIQELTIPASVTNIYAGWIASCANLTTITFNGDTPNFDSHVLDDLTVGPGGENTVTIYYPSNYADNWTNLNSIISNNFILTQSQPQPDNTTNTSNDYTTISNDMFTSIVSALNNECIIVQKLLGATRKVNVGISYAAKIFK